MSEKDFAEIQGGIKMRIQHNIMALNAHRNSGVNQTSVSKNMEKLSSGYRINRAGDDAAGLSISEKMRSQIRGLDQATRNAQDGISYIQTAEGALTEVSSMLSRAKELLVQKANTTYNTDDVKNINEELKQLGNEIASIVGNTKFNGKNVFTSSVDIAISHDASTKLTIDAAVKDGQTTGLNTIVKFTDGTDAVDPSDDTFDSAFVALGVHGTAGDTTVADVEGMINAVNTQRAVYGSQQNRLEHTINNLGTTSENLVAAESRIRDVDMAAEMVNYSKNSILAQAGQSMLAQANQATQGVLSLLQ